MGRDRHEHEELEREIEIERTRAGGGLGQALLAFLGGAVAGAAVALMIAPKSGRETRAAIKKVYRNSADQVGRIPAAFKSATHAARESLAESKQTPVEKESRPEVH